MSNTHQLVLAFKSPNRDRARKFRLGREHGYLSISPVCSDPDYLSGIRFGREARDTYLELREAKVREGHAKVDLSRIRLGLR